MTRRIIDEDSRNEFMRRIQDEFNQYSISCPLFVVMGRKPEVSLSFGQKPIT